MFIKTTYTL